MCKNKIKILMDISMLGNMAYPERAARSGIFFVALSLMNEFLKRDNIELSLYAGTAYYIYVLKALKTILPDKKIKIYTDSVICAFYNYFKSNFKYTKKISWKIKQFFMFVPAILAKAGTYIFPKHYDFNIFFSTYHYPPFSIRHQKTLKKFVLLHDCIPILNIYNEKLLGNHFKNKLFTKLEKNCFYFTNSEYTRTDFIKYNPNVTLDNTKTILLAASDKFKPTYEKFDIIRKKYNIPDDKKYVFSLCTLEPRKNLIRIVKTFVEFIKKNDIDDLIFVMGGGQWEKFMGELVKTIDNLDEYKSKILKIGYVADEDLPALYSNAEWFVYTSMYEGFGLPPLEAMACKCPVIVSNATSLPEVVGDAGLLINYDSDEEHIKAYETYYYNPGLRVEFAQKGYERSKNFSYKKAADEILDTMLG